MLRAAARLCEYPKQGRGADLHSIVVAMQGRSQAASHYAKAAALLGCRQMFDPDRHDRPKTPVADI